MRTPVVVLGLAAAIGGCELVSGLDDLEFGAGGGGPGGSAQGGGPGSGESSTVGSNTGGSNTGGGGGGDGGMGGQGGGGVLGIEAIYNPGFRHTCARRGSEILCWGQTPNTGLGDLAPQPASFPMGTVQPLVFDSYCGRTMPGDIRCWGGDNDLGQLGTGDTAPVPSPGPPVAIPAGATSYELSNGTGCAIVSTTPRSAYCWGENDSALVAYPGDSGPHATPTPIALPAPEADVDQIGLGLYVACARRGTEVICWGHNQYGALGVGTNDFLEYPPTAIVTTEAAKDLAVMNYGGCIMSVNDEAFCWGDPFATDGSVVPVPFLDGASLLSGGGNHVCGVRAGEVICVGYNSHLELGGPSFTDDQATVVIPGGAAQVVAGYQMSCARSLQGEVYCWGSNFAGALGIGSADEGSFDEPQLVTFP